jgi:hypothetical protein
VELELQALDADTREHFERLYDQLWHQLLSVDEYRARAAKGKASADAFAAAQGVRARLKKKVADQRELLGLCAYDADRAGLPARASVQEETASAAVPGHTAPAQSPAPPQTGAAATPAQPAPGASATSAASSEAPAAAKAAAPPASRP